MTGAHAATPAKITSIGRWDSLLEGIGIGFQVGEEIIRLRLDADSVEFLLECLPDAMNGYADLSHMLKSSGMPNVDVSTSPANEQ